MATRRKTAGKNRRAKLTAEEITAAATTLMLAAIAHQRASVWCMRNPDAKPPSIDALLFTAVSFELILLSTEQSLRLLLLLHYSMVRSDTNHNPHVLYKALKNKSGGKEGIRQNITSEMDNSRLLLRPLLGHINPISEKELEACLGKHDSSYTSARYFNLDHQAKSKKDWEVSPREVQILHCLALALTSLNIDEMQRRGISSSLSMSPVPESEMTEDLKALKERLTLTSS